MNPYRPNPERVVVGAGGEFTTCSIVECERASHLRGLCRMHYSRQRRGLPMVPGKLRVYGNTICVRCGSDDRNKRCMVNAARYLEERSPRREVAE